MANDTEPREVGVDLPALSCPNCGKEVEKVANEDGSFSGKTHESCFKAPSKKDIEAAEKARVTPAETGVEKEDS